MNADEDRSVVTRICVHPRSSAAFPLDRRDVFAVNMSLSLNADLSPTCDAQDWPMFEIWSRR
jgi:hypothetical protein